MTWRKLWISGSLSAIEALRGQIVAFEERSQGMILRMVINGYHGQWQDFKYI
jgi:hypothetical protein